MLVTTDPFVDLARMTLAAAGLKEPRLAVFGPVLGDCLADHVSSRALEMAAEMHARLLGE